MLTAKDIGRRLRILRGNKSQKAVADAIGIGVSTYSMYEIGQRVPRDGIKKKIAEFYKESIESIFYTGNAESSRAYLHESWFYDERYKYENESLYVVLSSGCIGYIENVCTCDECKQRGEVEIFINGLDGKYLDCIRHHELFDKDRVLNVGRSVAELSIEHSDMEIARFFADLYQNELFKTE